MALNLPPVPDTGVTVEQITAGLDVRAGVTLASPEAAVHLGNATTIEAVRQVTAALRSGLLDIDTTVDAIVGEALPDLISGLSGKADTEVVTGLAQSIAQITTELVDVARVGQIPSTPGEVGADPAGAADAVRDLLTTGYTTTTALSDGLAGKVNVGTYNSRQSVIDNALNVRPTTTEADARYATPTAVTAAVTSGVADRLTQAAGDARYATPATVTTAVSGKLNANTAAVEAVLPARLSHGSLSGSYASYRTLAANPDSIIAGPITRDGSGAARLAGVIWPDGTTGEYTATTMSTAFPGAVDAYTITYGDPVTRTFTQAAVTRNAAGAVILRPAMVVS